MAVLEEHRHRQFTADEFQRMLEAGILSEDERLELLEGELLFASPQDPKHVVATEKIRRELERVAGAHQHTRMHSPIAAGPDSLPEPDVALVKGQLGGFAERHPAGSDLVLTVEVAHTSQSVDRAKASIYARAGVEVYWTVDLATRRVEVRSEPLSDGRYRRPKTYTEDDQIPVPGTDVLLAARDLLP
jgi:Uma2 family endonuclease